MKKFFSMLLCGAMLVSFISCEAPEPTEVIPPNSDSDTTQTEPEQEIRTYTITIEYDESQGSVTGAGTYNESTIVKLTVTPNDDYIFTGWNDDNKDNPREIVVTEDITLIAIFNQYIQPNLNGHESVDLGLPSRTLWSHIM